MTNIFPLPFQFQFSKCFTGYIDLLNHLGYKRGLTYQSMPYNFTISYRSNKLNRIFLPNLKRLKQLTHKKVILIGHSLGNINIKHQLDKLSQMFKDSYIENWLALAPPFLGSLNSNITIIEGAKEYFWFGMFGMKFNTSYNSLATFAVQYELFLVNMYDKYKNEEWFKWVRERIQYENGEIKHSPFDFWPDKDQVCLPKFEGVNNKCFTGLEDISKEYSIAVGDQKYHLNQMAEIISKWTIDDDIIKNNEIFNDPDRFELKNPGVPLLVMFTRALPTVSQVTFPKDLLQYITQGNYPPSQTKMSMGDKLVSPNSAIIPPLKWAYEFHQSQKNPSSPSSYKVFLTHQPVKFIEFCGTQNTNDFQIYDDDGNGSDSPKSFSSSGYIGLPCDCGSSKNASSCNHSYIMNDTNVLKFTKNLLFTQNRYNTLYQNDNFKGQ